MPYSVLGFSMTKLKDHTSSTAELCAEIFITPPPAQAAIVDALLCPWIFHDKTKRSHQQYCRAVCRNIHHTTSRRGCEPPQKFLQPCKLPARRGTSKTKTNTDTKWFTHIQKHKHKHTDIGGSRSYLQSKNTRYTNTNTNTQKHAAPYRPTKPKHTNTD